MKAYRLPSNKNILLHILAKNILLYLLLQEKCTVTHTLRSGTSYDIVLHFFMFIMSYYCTLYYAGYILLDIATASSSINAHKYTFPGM